MEVFQDPVAEASTDMSDVAPFFVFPHGEDQVTVSRAAGIKAVERAVDKALAPKKVRLVPPRRRAGTIKSRLYCGVASCTGPCVHGRGWQVELCGVEKPGAICQGVARTLDRDEPGISLGLIGDPDPAVR
jgi:hypothetical protein